MANRPEHDITWDLSACQYSFNASFQIYAQIHVILQFPSVLKPYAKLVGLKIRNATSPKE
eukprot:4284350-Amphidinium_carterae.1